MARSSIFSPEDGYAYVLANGAQSSVKYWDITLPETSHQSICNAPEFVLDFVHGSVNSIPFLSLISEKGVRFFSQHLNNA